MISKRVCISTKQIHDLCKFTIYVKTFRLFFSFRVLSKFQFFCWSREIYFTFCQMIKFSNVKNISDQFDLWHVTSSIDHHFFYKNVFSFGSRFLFYVYQRKRFHFQTQKLIHSTKITYYSSNVFFKYYFLTFCAITKNYFPETNFPIFFLTFCNLLQ